MTLVGVGLIVSGIVLLFQMMRSPHSIELPAEDRAKTPPFQARPFAIALAAIASPILLMTSIGFPLTAAVMFAGVTHAFGSRRALFDLLVGAVLSVTCWFLFRWLGVDLGEFFPLLLS